MTNNSKKNIEKLFEEELYDSLKFHGYLFPENNQDVERFENLYGKTEIDTPSIESLLYKNNEIAGPNTLDLNMSMAAFSNTDNQLPDFFKDESSDMNNSKQESKESNDL